MVWELKSRLFDKCIYEYNKLYLSIKYFIEKSFLHLSVGLFMSEHDNNWSHGAYSNEPSDYYTPGSPGHKAALWRELWEHQTKEEQLAAEKKAKEQPYIGPKNGGRPTARSERTSVDIAHEKVALEKLEKFFFDSPYTPYVLPAAFLFSVYCIASFSPGKFIVGAGGTLLTTAIALNRTVRRSQHLKIAAPLASALVTTGVLFEMTFHQHFPVGTLAHQLMAHPFLALANSGMAVGSLFGRNFILQSFKDCKKLIKRNRKPSNKELARGLFLPIYVSVALTLGVSDVRGLAKIYVNSPPPEQKVGMIGSKSFLAQGKTGDYSGGRANVVRTDSSASMRGYTPKGLLNPTPSFG